MSLYFKVHIIHVPAIVEKKSLKKPTHTHKRVVGCLGVLEAMKKGINLYDKLQAQ